MTKYRSKYEAKVHKCLPETEYETLKLEYIQKRVYTPDFIDYDNKIVYEAKGHFTPSDRTKMKNVRDQNPGWTYVLIFMNPNNKISKISKTTYAKWAEKNNFEWIQL